MHFMVILTLISGLANAQDEVCPGQFALSEWREAMDAVDDAITSGNGTLAQRILDDVHGVMRCTAEVVTPADLGRYARQMSVVAFYAQDDEDAVAWALLARKIQGDTSVSAGLESYEQMLQTLPTAAVGGTEDKALVFPKKGAVLFDGRLSSEARALVSVPHLLQVVDKSGVATLTMWQDGAAFPEDLLGTPTSISTPKWYTEPPLPSGSDAVAEAAPVEEVPVEEVPVDEASVEAPVIDETLRFEHEKAVKECAWQGDVRKAWATGGAVYVNKESWSVRTDDERLAFGVVLRSCGEFRAHRRLNKWRAAKKSFSFKARTYREAMVEALKTPEPARKKRKSKK